MNLKTKFKNAGIFVLDIVINIVVLFVFVFLIREFLVAPFQVFGPSMCSTLNEYNGECQTGYGEYIILDKFNYLFHKPQRLDIIVFKPPNDDNIFFIKRIIGLPGDTIKIKNGDVFVNNQQLDETYLNQNNAGKTKSFKDNTFTVPENEYFLLGDNRNQSSDSRSCFSDTQNGCYDKKSTPFIKQERIEGKAWLVLWPFDFARILKSPEAQDLAEK